MTAILAIILTAQAIACLIVPQLTIILVVAYAICFALTGIGRLLAARV